jgi:hypothetical protein
MVVVHAVPLKDVTQVQREQRRFALDMAVAFDVLSKAVANLL